MPFVALLLIDIFPFLIAIREHIDWHADDRNFTGFPSHGVLAARRHDASSQLRRIIIENMRIFRR